MQQSLLRNMNVTILVTLCLIGASVRWTNAAGSIRCGECMDNYASCKNTTHFHVCYDGENPNLDKVFPCKEGTVCTNSPEVCVTQGDIAGDIVSVCDGTNSGSSSCNSCTETQMTCVSKTQYTVCVNGQPLPGEESCKPDEICSVKYFSEHKKICIPECAADFLELKPDCDSDEPVTSAPTTTEKPNVEDFKMHCEEKCGTGADYCYTYNLKAKDCKSYLYCEKFGNDWNFAILQCSGKTFWDDGAKACTTSPCKQPSPTPEVSS